MSPRPITFLSDFGLADEFVAVCKGVIWQVLPEVRIIDVTHNVPHHDVRSGALTMARAIQYLPPGVHIAVVDPGVGTERAPIAVTSADGRIFVGPDNGLLSPAVQVCGGASEAVILDPLRWGMEMPAATFHGRDVFAPAGAALAGGVPLLELGTEVDPAEMMPLLLPLCRQVGDGIACEVLWVDHYGNCATNVSEVDLEEAGIGMGDRVEIEWNRRTERADYVRAYGDVDKAHLLVSIDSAGQLAISVSHGNAARELGLAEGDSLLVRRAGSS
ncbi:hypothetical protein EDM76_04945 [bacterium]|nr:MAG: hypothetical protein EDM76_04945 [bacterium]